MIDWSCAAELRAEVGEEDFCEIIGLFFDETEEAIAKLRAGPAQAELESLMHFIKGSALNLGFVTLSEVCKDGELQARAGQAVDVQGVISCYEQSRDAFFAAGESAAS